MTTCASLFAGGGGWEVGALLAGLEPRWAIELDEAIAEVHQRNVPGEMLCRPVQEVAIARLEPVDVLFASPPCQAHSVARAKNLAARDDGDVGIVTLDYVRALRPRWLFLENVPPYQHAPVFKAIVRGLFDLGYMVDWSIVNAADYGVPQTRKRLVLRAYRDGLLSALPAPEPWVGWYAAIEDLIPSLPASRFADWQLKRLPEFVGSILAHPTDMRSMPTREGGEPSFTVTAGSFLESREGAWKPRAFILDGQESNGASGLTARAGGEPAFTVSASMWPKRPARAFIVGGANTSDGQAAPGVGVSDAGEPVRCVNASNSASWRAFLVSQDYDNPTGTVGRSPQIRAGDEPSTVIKATASGGRMRAFLVNGTSDVGVRDAHEPAATVEATLHAKAAVPRAWLEQGRVVAMTPRALARFQSFPDSYTLPERNSLACKVVGNAVPPLLAQRLLEASHVHE